MYCWMNTKPPSSIVNSMLKRFRIFLAGNKIVELCVFCSPQHIYHGVSCDLLTFSVGTFYCCHCPSVIAASQRPQL